MNIYGSFPALPHLVWCSITPFGLDGPWRDFAANDLVQLALGGTMMSSGYDDRDLPPVRTERTRPTIRCPTATFSRWATFRTG